MGKTLWRSHGEGAIEEHMKPKPKGVLDASAICQFRGGCALTKQPQPFRDAGWGRAYQNPTPTAVTFNPAPPTHDLGLTGPSSGSDWTAYELIAYNIQVIRQTKQEFFGVHDLPAPSNPTLVAFMTTQLRRDARDEATRKLLHFLDLEVNAEPGYEAASQNLVARLLETLGYDSVGRIIFFRRTIPLLICGVDSVAEPDFCLLKGDAILLMVQRSGHCCLQRDHLPPLPAIAFPAIALTNTNFMFYKSLSQLNSAALLRREFILLLKRRSLDMSPCSPATYILRRTLSRTDQYFWRAWKLSNRILSFGLGLALIPTALTKFVRLHLYYYSMAITFNLDNFCCKRPLRIQEKIKKPPSRSPSLSSRLVLSQLSVMSRYPYRHSTYFTRSDALETSSELPPMNSREDILQDLFMNDPSNFHHKEVTPVQKLESVGRRLKDMKKGFRTSMIAFGHSFRRRRTDSTTRLLMSREDTEHTFSRDLELGSACPDPHSVPY
ncbi:uncharacterized protein LACBIDRAFT_325234 [Laccaria bicolor S238N-H82]|uniref:Predicted protein n=1 Tax=Laccaria bicolor (strain S238N-H82 / ATCC MYA-4686) TaxID=486041 RepID=B0D498_LACBS|nr:uncharacterized protein LACBIDRAFT_325234 [Laccaria bicolor S238N-H82]EDR10538.1 predicted protein [Laccaria bicolor S238N-H82]|eukprot:XP_001878988.1 predicted protein [Laccaria bicolor S238N-H82]